MKLGAEYLSSRLARRFAVARPKTLFVRCQIKPMRHLGCAMNLCLSRTTSSDDAPSLHASG